MSTGRKYIEKMMEGVTDFNMAGGTLLYKIKSETISANTTLTAAQSGTHFMITANEVTASLPAATEGAGIVYSFSNVVAAATADLLITSSTAGSSFLGMVGAGSQANADAYADITGGDFALHSQATAASDTFTIISTGTKWAVIHSNVSGSTWKFKATAD
tara:strand:- start:114 stop:593 length:480 start_codon:yes stop_codon:yes gene_type:complete